MPRRASIRRLLFPGDHGACQSWGYTGHVGKPEDAPGLREAIALSDVMLEMRLQRLRVQHPELTEREAVMLLNKELSERPPDGGDLAASTRHS